METIINKAGIKEIPIKNYVISANDVSAYLEKVLGFPITCKFSRCNGAVVPQFSYVVMRTIMARRDLVPETKTQSYVDRVLADNAAGITFKEDVIAELAPFMYPTNLNNAVKDQAAVDKLAIQGLVGDNMAFVLRHARFKYSKQDDMFMICLMPEKIIKDMLSDPTTGLPDGKLSIIAIDGDTNETIRWKVEVSNINPFTDGLSGIDIDKIFK